MNPQFSVVMPSAASSHGTKVYVNGEALNNVVSVTVDSGAALDELVTSGITIRLIGEVIPVIIGEGEGQSL